MKPDLSHLHSDAFSQLVLLLDAKLTAFQPPQKKMKKGMVLGGGELYVALSGFYVHVERMFLVVDVFRGGDGCSKWLSRYSFLAQIVWAIETKEKRFSHKKTFRLVFASPPCTRRQTLVSDGELEDLAQSKLISKIRTDSWLLSLKPAQLPWPNEIEIQAYINRSGTNQHRLCSLYKMPPPQKSGGLQRECNTKSL